MKRIFLLQRKAIRIILGAKHYVSCKPLFIKHNLLALPAIYVLDLAVFVYKNIDILEGDQVEHSYNMRKTSVRFPKHRLTLLESGPHYAGVRLVNKVSADMRGAKNVKT